MAVSIKVWNSLTDKQREEAVNFVLADSISTVKNGAKSVYKNPITGLNALQKIMLSCVYQKANGKIVVKIEKEL